MTIKNTFAAIICTLAVFIIPSEAIRIADSFGRTNGTGLLVGFALAATIMSATLTIFGSSTKLWRLFNACICLNLLYNWHIRSWQLKQLLSTLFIILLVEFASMMFMKCEEDKNRWYSA